MRIWGSKGYGYGYCWAKYQTQCCLIRPPNPISNITLNENICFPKKILKIIEKNNFGKSYGHFSKNVRTFLRFSNIFEIFALWREFFSDEN